MEILLIDNYGDVIHHMYQLKSEEEQVFPNMQDGSRKRNLPCDLHIQVAMDLDSQIVQTLRREIGDMQSCELEVDAEIEKRPADLIAQYSA
jgi:hypothetical protein